MFVSLKAMLDLKSTPGGELIANEARMVSDNRRMSGVVVKCVNLELYMCGRGRAAVR